jgi:hypothetical protein
MNSVSTLHDALTICTTLLVLKPSQSLKQQSENSASPFDRDRFVRFWTCWPRGGGRMVSVFFFGGAFFAESFCALAMMTSQ